MAGMVQVTGVKEILKSLLVRRGDTAKGMERGLVKAGLQLLRWSQQVVPVDTGNLRASGFSRKTGEGFKANVEVGYTAEYAVYVHENLDARHAPGKIAKYLERPAREHREELKQIIQAELTVAGRSSATYAGYTGR